MNKKLLIIITNFNNINLVFKLLESNFGYFSIKSNKYR